MNLIINPGSSTIKFDFFRNEKRILHAKYEGQESMKNFLKRTDVKEMLEAFPLKKIAFRVVHGGMLFRKPTILNEKVMRNLKKLDELAPLHNPFTRKIIRQAKRAFPGVKIILIFDTAFHKSLPEENWRYALPAELSSKYQLRRFGFHGTACLSIVNQIKSQGKLKRRIIICHLGSGCSVTAVLKGKSFDTSMGFTPLEGLIMGTRSGDIDPGLVIALQKKHHLNPDQILRILNDQSGLKGLTGNSDMREIIKMSNKKNHRARKAIEMFSQKAAKYIAAYCVSLGGLDHLVFSGGIGENSPMIREKICQYLKPLGIKINAKQNLKAKVGKRINHIFSKAIISCIKADEGREMNNIILKKN